MTSLKVNVILLYGNTQYVMQRKILQLLHRTFYFLSAKSPTKMKFKSVQIDVSIKYTNYIIVVVVIIIFIIIIIILIIIVFIIIIIR